MPVSKITRVIGVEDMERAVGFYTALCLSVGDQNPHWANLTCGDGNLELQAYRPAEPTIVHTMVILTVEDLEAAISAAEEAGGKLQKRPCPRRAGARRRHRRQRGSVCPAEALNAGRISVGLRGRHRPERGGWRDPQARSGGDRVFPAIFQFPVSVG